MTTELGISLKRIIRMGTGFAGFRRVETAVKCEEHTHRVRVRARVSVRSLCLSRRLRQPYVASNR